MDIFHYEEMVSKFTNLLLNNVLDNKRIFIFGHCDASEKLIDLLRINNLEVIGFLDNNASKQNKTFKNVMIYPPNIILEENKSDTIVLIVSRAYNSMCEQLRRIGYKGEIYKLTDYDPYSDNSLSETTIKEKKERLSRGIKLFEELSNKYHNYYRIICPYHSIGDVFYAMSYLPYFLEKKQQKKVVVAVIGDACRKVVEIFGYKCIEVYSWNDMTELVQAVLYKKDCNSFVSHNDKPYVTNVSDILYKKLISFEKMYCCGVYGLPIDTQPFKPSNIKDYKDQYKIKSGKSVILSPYANSVTNLSNTIWLEIVEFYKNSGYNIYTNAVGNEKEILGTKKISLPLDEMQSLVEEAGIFIGLRSGLCDIIKYADCKKIALYSDYYFSKTRWKSIDVFSLDGWENIEVIGDVKWNKIL